MPPRTGTQDGPSGSRGSASAGASSDVPMAPRQEVIAPKEDIEDFSGALHTPLKRSRSMRSLDSSVQRPSRIPRTKRQLDVEDIDGATDQASGDPSGDGGAGLSADEVVECVGCLRSNSKDNSFMLPGAELEFTYLSKHYCWCKDCHTVWRLVYKSRLTLALMERFLKSPPARLRFVKELIALLSLRFDNCSRANLQAINQRVDMLQFIFDLCNIPFPFFQAIPVADLDMAQYTPGALNFAELFASGKSSLIALRPLGAECCFTSTTSRSVRVPSSQQQRLRSVLHTNSEADLEWWDANIATEPVDATSANTTKPEDSVDMAKQHNDASTPQEKAIKSCDFGDDTAMKRKVRGALETTIVSLSDFGDDRCFTSLREKSLSKQLSKLLNLQHQLLRSPDASLCGPVVSQCIEAMTSAKSLLQPLLQYMKGFSSQKLADVCKHAAPLCKFFDDHGMDFGTELRRVFWRGKLEQEALKSAECATEWIKSGEKELLTIMGGDADEVHNFLADCIGNVVSNFLSSSTSQQKTMETVRDELSAQVDLYIGALSAMDSCKGKRFIELLQSTKLVLEAAMPETRVLPGQLSAAKNELDDPFATKLKYGWFGSSTGTAILADADMLLVASALDDDCLAEFALAERAIGEEGMPNFDENKRVLTGGEQLISEGGVVPLLNDAVKQLALALKSWSPVGVEATLCRIHDVLYRILASVVLYDVSLSRLFIESWRDFEEGWTAIFDKLPVDAPMPFVDATVASRAMDALELQEPDETEFTNVLHTATAMVKSLGHMRGQGEDTRLVLDRLDNALAVAIANSLARARMFNELSTKATLVSRSYDDLPGDSKLIVEDFLQTSPEQKGVMRSAIHLAQLKEGTEGILRAHALELKHILIASRDGASTEILESALVALSEDWSQTVTTRFFINRFINRPMVQVVNDWWADLQFIAELHFPEQEELAAHKSSKELMSLLMPPVLAAQLAKDFDPGVKTREALPKHLGELRLSKQYDLVMLLIGVGLEGAIRIPHFSSKECSSSIFETVFPVMSEVMKVLAIAAWVEYNVLQPKKVIAIIKASGAVPQGLCIEPSVRIALAAVGELTSWTRTMLGAICEQLKLSGTKANHRQASALLDALDAWRDLAESVVFQEAAAKMEETTNSCEQACPRWSHIVSHDSYKAPLAKRQLLQSPCRSSLPPAQHKLRTLMDSVKETYDLWRKPKCIEDCADISEAFAAAQAVMEMSEVALAVLAALNILEDIGATAQGQSLASEFLSVGAPKDFPKVLETKLRQLVSK